jgi:uncharacterized protein with HEPN domain
MSDRSSLLYINDIIDSAEAIFSYTKGVDFSDFLRDRMRYSAVIREFEIIGEAVAKLPDDIKTKYPDVHWQDIKDFRNMLIHEYFGIDLEIVWNVVKEDLPTLYNTIKQVKEEHH